MTSSSGIMGVGTMGVLCLLAWGCSQKEAEAPSEDQAALTDSLRKVCEVDQLAKLDPNTDPIGVEAERQEWLMQNVRHPDAIELVTLMRVESNKTRSQMLRDATRGCAIATCPLADHYAQTDDLF